MPINIIDGSGPSPAGSSQQLQYNNNGVFGASSNLTFDGSTLAVVGSIDSDNPLVIQTTTLYYNNETGDGTIATVSFNNNVADRGNDFSGNTTFTAPEAGYYQVSCVVGLAYSAAPTTASLQVAASNRSMTLARVNPSTMGYPAGSVLCLGGSVLIDMDAADTLTITMACYGTTKTVGFDVAPRNWLTIFKIA